MGLKNRKQKGRRARSKYPGLDPKVNRVNLRDLIDFDYISKLSDKDKEWLSKWSKEYYSADFRHEKPIHKAKKSRLEIYRNNNSRNQDTTAYLGNFNQIASIEEMVRNEGKGKRDNASSKLGTKFNEDAYVELLDLKIKK